MAPSICFTETVNWGAEEEIIGKLKELENVKEVHGTFGGL